MQGGADGRWRRCFIRPSFPFEFVSESGVVAFGELYEGAELDRWTDVAFAVAIGPGFNALKEKNNVRQTKGKLEDYKEPT
jgi:hypothetical protein